jgi:hypothetical protein
MLTIRIVRIVRIVKIERLSRAGGEDRVNAGNVVCGAVPDSRSCEGARQDWEVGAWRGLQYRDLSLFVRAVQRAAGQRLAIVVLQWCAQVV